MSYFNQTSTDWRLSQCCQFHDKKLAKQFNFGTTTKTYALKDGGKKRVQDKALSNVHKLYLILEHYFSKQPRNLRSFRISSEMFPCYTLDFTQDWYKEIWDEICEGLHKCGEIAKYHEIRLSVHPGQYTVLGSPKANVVENSIKDLEYHALYGKLMGLPAEDFTMNIHLQGLYGGKHIDGIKRFASNFQYLSDYAQGTLSVENEDKPNGYDIEHTLELAARIPTRTCLDIHHYACHRMRQNEKVKNSEGKVVNRKIRDEVRHISVNDDFFKEAVKTWKGVRPLFHKSQCFPIENEAYWMKPNAHSEMYHDEDLMSNAIPMLEYADFEVEAKHKEVAVNHFYDYIHAEQDMAGEMLQTKTFAN